MEAGPGGSSRQAALAGILGPACCHRPAAALPLAAAGAASTAVWQQMARPEAEIQLGVFWLSTNSNGR